MNKPEIISVLAEKTGAKKKEAEMFLNAFVETVEETLVRGDKIALIGFGGFGTRTRKARMGVNPRTGKSIHIKATTVPYFRPGKKLREKVK